MSARSCINRDAVRYVVAIEAKSPSAPKPFYRHVNTGYDNALWFATKWAAQWPEDIVTIEEE